MKRWINREWSALRALHQNENGAEAGLERILLVAFIALPLLGLLIYYRGKVAEFIKTSFGEATSEGQKPVVK